MEVQTYEIEEKETQTSMVTIEEELPKFDYSVKKTMMLGRINHGVSIIKRIFQYAHSVFIGLKNVEHLCNEALLWLKPIFNYWIPCIQFFDRLIPLMEKKLDLLDKIIIVKEWLDLVK